MTGCARCHTPLEAGDLRCAICSKPAPFDASATHDVVAEILRCHGCGAAIEYDVRVQAPRCAFCDSVMELEKSVDPVERAEAYLPFSVNAETAQSVLGAWLGSRGFFRPSDLASASTLKALTPLWWVAWTFDAEGLVSWAADSNAGSGRSAWAPHCGQTPMDVKAVVVSASRGLSLGETNALTPHFDLRTAASEPQRIAGAIVERFDVQRSTARRIVAHAVEAAAKGVASRWIPGTTYRNLEVSVLLRKLLTRRLAFPSWVLAYRYRGELFRVVIHGQNPQVVLGDSPISWLKVALVVGGAIAALILFGAIALGVLALAAQ